MTFIAAIGQAQATDAREAGMQAAYQALNGVGTVSPALGLLIVPQRYDHQQVINGAGSILSNIPLIGFSVSAGLSKNGANSQTIIVALLAGDSLQAETHWFPEFSQSSASTLARIKQLIDHEQHSFRHVLAFAEGLDGRADLHGFCNQLPEGLSLFGGLASGDMLSENSFQIAGLQSGSGALATAFLRGNFQIGSGHGHGWIAAGNQFTVTRANGYRLEQLDGKPVTEAYAQVFGESPAAWTQAPLNTLSRIYPLGLEEPSSPDLTIQAPICIHGDGSMQMTASITEGSRAYLMIGSTAGCLEAAQKAAQKALLELGEARPVFALVLVDSAWQAHLQAQPGAEFRVIQDVLGAKVQVAVGYIHGQIVPPGENNSRARLLNQEILVVVFGEK